MAKPLVTDWTYDHLVKQYADFLVVCLHSICYYRGLYDRAYFSLARAYNCPVQKCKHPILIEYINSVVTSIAEELRKSLVERINVVVLNSQDVPLERFVFDVSTLPQVAAADIHVPFKDTQYQVGQLDSQFRAAILKLALVETKLGAVPKDCTFAVQIQLRQNVSARATDAWIDAETRSNSGAGKTLVPLRSIGFGPIALDSWVEETQAKLKQAEESDDRSSGSTRDLYF